MSKELFDLIAKLAQDCKSAGANNVAIVLYILVGTIIEGTDYDFASWCRDYAKSRIRKLDTP